MVSLKRGLARDLVSKASKAKPLPNPLRGLVRDLASKMQAKFRGLGRGLHLRLNLSEVQLSAKPLRGLVRYLAGLVRFSL
jgi:hypothetical protein